MAMGETMILSTSWSVAAGAAVVACAAVIGLVPLARRLCAWLGAWDEPDADSRRVHRRRVLRGPGIVVVIAFVALLLTFDAGWLSSPFFIAPMLLLSLVGLFDDVFDLPAVAKLLAQIVAVLVALFGCDVVMPAVNLPIFDWQVESPLLVSGFALVLAVGMVNSINFIDGLDGLASSLGLVVCLAIAFLAGIAGNSAVLIASATLGGALVGFLPWNGYPAKVFLGDAGSLGIGFAITVLAFGLVHPPAGSAAGSYGIGIPLLVLALPLADAIWVISTRLVRGRHPFSGDREHIHHYLLDIGLSHRHAVLLLVTLGLACAGMALLLHGQGRDVVFFALICVVQGLLGAVRLFPYTPLYARLKTWNQRRQVERVRAAIRDGGLPLPAVAVFATGLLLAITMLVVGAVVLPSAPGSAMVALAILPFIWLLLAVVMRRPTHRFAWLFVFLGTALLAGTADRYIGAAAPGWLPLGVRIGLLVSAGVTVLVINRLRCLSLIEPTPAEWIFLVGCLVLPLPASGGQAPDYLGGIGLSAGCAYILLKSGLLALSWHRYGIRRRMEAMGFGSATRRVVRDELSQRDGELNRSITQADR